MIKDTCRCGAQLELTITKGYNDYSSRNEEAAAHKSWLEAHTPCRERQAERLPHFDPPFPSSPPFGPFPATSPTIVTHAQTDTTAKS